MFLELPQLTQSYGLESNFLNSKHAIHDILFESGATISKENAEQERKKNIHDHSTAEPKYDCDLARIVRSKRVMTHNRDVPKRMDRSPLRQRAAALIQSEHR